MGYRTIKTFRSFIKGSPQASDPVNELRREKESKLVAPTANELSRIPIAIAVPIYKRQAHQMMESLKATAYGWSFSRRDFVEDEDAEVEDEEDYLRYES